VLKRRECSGFARVNKVISASLGYPPSVFNKNSTLKSAKKCNPKKESVRMDENEVKAFSGFDTNKQTNKQTNNPERIYSQGF